VSNGREVVKTDASGRYALPIEDGRCIFVVKPTGYAVPVDENMLPRFYYCTSPRAHRRASICVFVALRRPGHLPMRSISQ
jgi:N terminal of Calcineurin-like phosphoesterase